MLEAETYNALITTMRRDCRVLESFRIMDYSLLIGIHNLDQAAKEQAVSWSWKYRHYDWKNQHWLWSMWWARSNHAAVLEYSNKIFNSWSEYWMNTCCRLEMAQFFGLDKVAKLRTIIKVVRPPISWVHKPIELLLSQDHGGLKAALYHLYWTDDLKVRSRTTM